MGKRTREITDDQCQWFSDDMANLDMEVGRALSRHAAFERNEWLGGDQDANNTEAAPARCAKAMKLLRSARALIAEADHEVALFRAGVKD